MTRSKQISTCDFISSVEIVCWFMRLPIPTKNLSSIDSAIESVEELIEVRDDVFDGVRWWVISRSVVAMKTSGS